MYNKSFLSILFLAGLISLFGDDVDDVSGRYFPQTKPAYGEENAPEDIYYKYVGNNKSDVFFYSLNDSKGETGNRRVMILIISLQSNTGIFLLYKEEYNIMDQFTLVLWPSGLFHEREYTGGYWTNKKTDIAFTSELSSFMNKQFEYNYKLISKKDLIRLLDDTIPDTAAVRMNSLSISDTFYIRGEKSASQGLMSK